MLSFGEFLFEKLEDDAKKGIKVWRGENPELGPSDPGDFGIGRYHTTSRARAKQYGPPVQTTLAFKNPMIMKVKDAYDLADQYGTVRGTQSTRKAGAFTMTRDLDRLGHDGMIVVHPRGELEVVDYRLSRVTEVVLDK